MSKKRNHSEEKEYEYDFAMSFADMMTALVGAFLVLMMFFMFENSTNAEMLLNSYKNFTASQQQVEGLIGVRKNLVKEIRKTFIDSNLDISIDIESGAIRCSDKVLFNYDSDVISESGKRYLNEFIPKYMSILLADGTRDNLSEILIEGHTDNNGSYIYNLDLSQRRALAVSKYISSSQIQDFKNKEYLNTYLTSSGKSFSKLISTNGKVDPDASRRVEFKFRLREEDTINEIQKLLSE